MAFDSNYIFIKGLNGMRLQQMMSGSPLRADGRLAGILLSVKTSSDGTEQGTVFRLSYIDSIVSSIFSPATGTVSELSVAELQRIDQNIAIARVALDKRRLQDSRQFFDGRSQIRASCYLDLIHGACE